MNTEIKSKTDIKTKSDWSPEHISAFWDWLSLNKAMSDKYFTRMVGNGLCRIMTSHFALKGNVLDYGCGEGTFLKILLEKKLQIDLYGLEFSDNSAQITERKLKDSDWFRGVEVARALPSNYQESTFDNISFFETIEHLKDDILDDTLKEIYRLLKPGGKLIVTTPFDEDLTDNTVYCPFCNSEFHHMQHMQSFNKESITELLEIYGFKVFYCQDVSILLEYELSTLHKFIYSFKGYTKRILSNLGIGTHNKVSKKPNLVLIATK